MTQRGFTLIELSLVLIIIGLLVAGIVSGQSLINQARLRSVVADVNNYKAALNIFALEYDALPGDMENATDYWTASVTENGDNDYRIEDGSDEHVRAWQHLALSEILPHEYTGSGGTSTLILGENIPASNVEAGGFMWDWRTNTVYGKAADFQALVFGSVEGSSGHTYGGLLAPRDAHSIDLKYDDGTADSGFVIAQNGYQSGGSQITPAASNACVDGDIESDAEGSYILTNTERNSCSLFFTISSMTH